MLACDDGFDIDRRGLPMPVTPTRRIMPCLPDAHQHATHAASSSHACCAMPTHDDRVMLLSVAEETMSSMIEGQAYLQSVHPAQWSRIEGLPCRHTQPSNKAPSAPPEKGLSLEYQRAFRLWLMGEDARYDVTAAQPTIGFTAILYQIPRVSQLIVRIEVLRRYRRSIYVDGDASSSVTHHIAVTRDFAAASSTGHFHRRQIQR